jgi:hypothetical protein
MKTKSQCPWVLIALACLSVISQSQAEITVSVNPAPQATVLGGSTFVNVAIAGLYYQNAAIGLGGFSIGLTYDPAIVHFDGLVFGNGLNLGTGADSVQFSDNSTLGLLLVDETSLLDSATLNAGQPSGFSLFQVGFTGLTFGTSPVNLSQVQLSDLGGGTLTAAEILDGSIDVPDALPFGWIASVLGLVLFVGSPAFRRSWAARTG